jgi:hypothetical protein
LDPTLQKEIVRRWLLALGCYALLIFFFSPPWAAYQNWARVPELGGMIEVRRGGSVLWQAEHLGAPVPDQLHAAIQWRLLFPLVARVLHLPPMGLLALAHLGCVLTLAFIITVLRRRGASFFAAALATIILGAASWFTTSVCWLGYFDSWVVLGLLLVAFARSPWTVLAACACAPWVDERFVIGAAPALLCRYLDTRERSETDRPNVRLEFMAPIALLLVFAVVRIWVLSASSAAGATVGPYLANLRVSDAPVSRFVLGVWEGLRIAWLGVAVAVIELFRRRPADGVVLGVVVVMIVAIGLGTAQDFGRAMMFVLPVALTGFAALAATPMRWPRWAPFAAGAALVLPAHHVMSDRVLPVFYLYHELAAFNSPPAAVMPELQELRGIHAMQDGKMVEAAEALSLAIKLARNPTGPSKQRGVLFASNQKWAEARADFSTMIQHEPKNPDGWFLRSQANAALGDAVAAMSDMEEALAVAPPGWVERPDVIRFRARLRSPAGK